MARQGIGWVDMPVAGGGGEAAMTALARARDGGRSADGRADAGLRHSGLGLAGRAGRPDRGRDRRRLGCGGADGAAGVLQVRRQVDCRAGERALDQLGLDQQGRARHGRRQGAGDVGRTRGRARRDEGQRDHPARPWRPALAGRDDLRRGRAVGRAGLLQGGDDRPRSGGAGRPTDGRGVRPHGASCAPMSTTTSRAATGTSPRRWSSTTRPGCR